MRAGSFNIDRSFQSQNHLSS